MVVVGPEVELLAVALEVVLLVCGDAPLWGLPHPANSTTTTTLAVHHPSLRIR
jgi:hypothetical protein